MNESYHISSFRSLRKFTNKLPFLWHLLDVIKATKNGKKIETVAWSPYCNTRTLCFHKQRSVFRYVSASRSRNVYLTFLLKIDPRRKNDISGYIWHRAFIQTVKCSFFNQIIVSQSFCGALLSFTSRKSSVFPQSRRQVCDLRNVYFWSIPKTLSKKLYLQLYLTQIVHSNSKMLFI